MRDVGKISDYTALQNDNFNCRSVIENHAAQCIGLYETDGSTCDPSRVTCTACGQKFGHENYKQHSQYCGEVVV